MTRAPSRPLTKAQRRAQRRLIADYTPPEGVPIGFEVASLGARLIAQLIDIALTVTAFIGLLIALVFADFVPPEGISIVGALLYFSIRVPYYAFSELLMNGQTLGKKFAGMRVIAANGRTLTPHSVAVRNLMKEIEVFLPATSLLAAPTLDLVGALILMAWICILIAVPLTNRHRQRLGDILAGTYVVLLPKPVLLPDLAEAPVAPADYAFLPHQLDHYGRFELQTLEALLQIDTARMGRTALRRHTENLSKVAQTIATRIGYPEAIPETAAAAFLLAFYRTQRAYLENKKLFGDSREDKFHRDDPAASLTKSGDTGRGIRKKGLS
ncbi:MAG: RDD family protein [Pseudomonadota bacterium]